MRVIWLMIMMIGLPVIADANLYYCRDSQGRLHVADGLQNLPEECRGEARQVEPTDQDKLQIVPERGPDPTQTRPRLDQELREQQHRIQQQQAAAEGMVAKARELATRYEQAQHDRRNALRRWTYDSRRIIQDAADQSAEAQRGKQQLLTELERERVPAATAQQVREILSRIGD